MKKPKRTNIYQWLKQLFKRKTKLNLIIIDDPGYGGATPEQKAAFHKMIENRVHINCPCKVSFCEGKIKIEGLDHLFSVKTDVAQ